jgi:hypothetical protein
VSASPVRLLLVHGAATLLLGLLCGYPWWLGVVMHREGWIRGWRVAHLVLVTTGLVLLVVALLLPGAGLPPGLATLVAWPLVAAAYGFSFAFVGGALARERALWPFPLGMRTVLFAGHFIGAAGSTVGIAVLLFGLLR